MRNNVGPYGPPLSTTWQDYNPRCIRRDFRPEITARSLTYVNVSNALNKPTFDEFALALDPIHSSAHAGVGGMNDDVYSGNGDPAFFALHTQVDHLYTLWQAQDYERRRNVVTQTLTFANSKLRSSPLKFQRRV